MKGNIIKTAFILFLLAIVAGSIYLAARSIVSESHAKQDSAIEEILR